MNHRIKMTGIYTLLHFMVDFTTISLLVGMMLGPKIGIIHRSEAIIVYNIIAFAGQLPIGMIADALPQKRNLVALGCALAGIAYPVVFVAPWTACVLAAIGNGAFHIGAGVEILDWSLPKAGPSGVFVSSGALGVWLAYRLGGTSYIWLCPVFMILGLVLLLAMGKEEKEVSDLPKIRYGKPGIIPMVAVGCFMLTIVIRSLLGMVMNFPWKAEPALSFMAVLAVVAGKAMGGFLGDRWGYLRVAIVSLMISLVGFCCSLESWIAGVLAVLCFNMTMPLTLTAIAQLCGKKYGFAFGLTTFALAIGFIPAVFGANSWFGVFLLTGGSFASLLLLVLGYLLMQKQRESKR